MSWDEFYMGTSHLSRKQFMNMINKWEIRRINPWEPSPGVPPYRKYMQLRLEISDILK